MESGKSVWTSVLSEFIGAISLLGGRRFERKEERTIPAGEYSHLNLRDANGSITVVGTEGEEVVISATKRVRARSEEEARRRLNQIRIVILEEKPNLKITTDVSELHPKGSWSVNYEVHLPMHMSLSVHTSNGNIGVSDLRKPVQVETNNGNIKAHRIGSPVAARTSNGNIKLYEIKGAIEATTSNGNVHGELCTLDRGKRTMLRSSNGNIHLAVPEDTSAKVAAVTKNGNVRCDLPITISLQRRNHLEGTIGSGEGEIELRTTNGNVRIVPMSVQ